jgi:hypothetical protein
MKAVSVRQLLTTYIPSISILVGMVSANALFRVSMDTMTRDIAALANIHPLSGIVSNLGVLLWCATASICAFTAVVFCKSEPNDTFKFLLYSAFLSVYFLFDDFFLFHEILASWYFGLSEKIIFAVLGITVSAYLIIFRRVILRTNFGILLMALGFLTTSVGVDTILEPWLSCRLGHWEYFIEDGAKWLGISSWCSYYVETCYQFLVEESRL